MCINVFRYRRLKHGGAGVRLKPIVDIIIDARNINSALVVDGYQCIQTNLNTVRCVTMMQTFDVQAMYTKFHMMLYKSLTGVLSLACCLYAVYMLLLHRAMH
jgi:hypothetical protein